MFLSEIRQTKQRTKRATRSRFGQLVYDCQGMGSKLVWRDILTAQVDSSGGCLWVDAATHLLSRQEESTSTSTGTCTSTSRSPHRAAPLPSIDFKYGTGSRGKNNARVASYAKQYQRLFANKRRQYHWLDSLRPRIIAETHFSLSSAARNHGAADTVWFAKEPGMQRGTGIRVMTGAQLRLEKHHSVNATSSSPAQRVVYQRAIGDGKVACCKDGRKFDLRMYILIEPSQQQEIYLYHDAVVRVAPQPYRGNDDVTLKTQLTNVATGGSIFAGRSMELFATSFEAIQELMLQVVTTLKPWFQQGRCDLLGVDIMLDTCGRPFLVELNSSPSMGSHGTSLLFRRDMLEEMLHLAIYPELLRQYEKEKNIAMIQMIRSVQKEVDQHKGQKKGNGRNYGGWIPLVALGKDNEDSSLGEDDEDGEKEEEDEDEEKEERKENKPTHGKVRFAWLKDEIDDNKIVGVLSTLDSETSGKETGIIDLDETIIGRYSHPDEPEDEKIIVCSMKNGVCCWCRDELCANVWVDRIVIEKNLTDWRAKQPSTPCSLKMKEFDNTIVDIYGSFVDEKTSASTASTNELLTKLRTLTASFISSTSFAFLENILDISVALSTIFTMTTSTITSAAAADASSATLTTTTASEQDYHAMYTAFEPKLHATTELLCTIFHVNQEDTSSIQSHLLSAKSKHPFPTFTSTNAQLILELLDPFSTLQSHAIWKQQISNDDDIIATRCLLTHIYAHREYLIRKFAYSVPTSATMSLLAAQPFSTATVISLGCGKAYWAHCLRACGLNVVPADIVASTENAGTDKGESYCKDIVQVDPNDQSLLWNIIATRNATTSTASISSSSSSCLLLCWVPKNMWMLTRSVNIEIIDDDDNDGFVHAIKTFPGNYLVLVGEIGVSSACGSTTFWKHVHQLYHEIECVVLPRFLGWYDNCVVLEKKK